MKTQDKSIIINDLEINFREIFPESKSDNLIVFLHEGLGSIGQWKDFPSKLCELTGINGLVYDRYGYGKSSPLREQRQPDYLHLEAGYLNLLLNKLNINKKVIIFGHSDGASIALIFAALFPERVKCIISEAAHVFIEKISILGIKAAKKLYEAETLKNSLEKYHGTNTDTMFYGWANRWLSTEFHSWNIEDLLTKITCPVLVIQGENDQYGTLKQVESIQRHIVGQTKTLVLPNCGHVPHFEKEDIVLQEVVRFIEKQK